jgi:hypothetical protein
VNENARRIRAVVAISAVGAGLMVMPAIAAADDPPSTGTTDGTSAGAVAGGAAAASGGSSAGGSQAAPSLDGPAGIVNAAGGAIVRAGGQMVDAFGPRSAVVPKGLSPTTVVPRPVAVAPAVTEPVVAAAPAGEGAPAEGAAPASLAAAAAPAPAPDPAPAAAPAPNPATMDPVSASFARSTATDGTKHCGCGWVPDDQKDNPPPPDNPPPDDNPPKDQKYGWGLPIGAPGIGVPGGGKKYKYVACGAAVTLPLVPTTPTATTVVVTLPPGGIPVGGGIPGGIPGGGGVPIGGGGGTPLTLLSGGAPLGGAPGNSVVAMPAGYPTGLTFETGLDDRSPTDGVKVAGALSAILLAVGGCWLSWRRNAQRQAGRQCSVPVCRVPDGGLWE